MRRARLLMLLALAGLLATLLIVSLSTAFAQDEAAVDSAAYTGAETCGSCHRGISNHYPSSLHNLALQANSTAASAGTVADFAAGAEIRTLQFPGEEAARPFTMDDVAYLIGAGRYAQRFAWADAAGTLYVLPVEWSSVDGAWHAFELGEEWPSADYDFGQNCAYCHTSGFDRMELTWQDDGVWCESCHGPGADHVTLAEAASSRPAQEDLTAIRAAIFNTPDSQVCGQCHNRGVAPDGRPYPLGYTPGKDLLDDDVFELVAADDETHWWVESGHVSMPNMQFNEWVASAHANSPAALNEADYAEDSCLRCHSADYRYAARITADVAAGELLPPAPEPVTLANATQGIACQTCHNPHFNEGRPYMLVDESYTLCVECHSNTGIEGYVHHPNQEMVEGLSLHEDVSGIASAHFTADDGPDCQTCHMARLPVGEGTRASHALRAIMPEPLETVAGCSSCHDSITPQQIAQFVADTQANTQTRLAAAQAAAGDNSSDAVAVALGMVEGDASNGLHNPIYTHALLLQAETALGLLSEPVVEESTPPPDFVNLPVIGEIYGMTWPLFIGGGVAFFVGLLLGVIFVSRSSWLRILGVVFLLAAMLLLVVLGVYLLTPAPAVQATGDDSYCLLCHGSVQTYTLADGTAIQLGVDAAALAASVHGTASPDGRMGCVDCHGPSAYPHEAPPASLREYRQTMSQICLDCHQDDSDHYEDVLAKNIAVGCADCHGAHAVQPAETLQDLIIIPTAPEGFTPTETGTDG